jgi:hypothetical protein
MCAVYVVVGFFGAGSWRRCCLQSRGTRQGRPSLLCSCRWWAVLKSVAALARKVRRRGGRGSCGDSRVGVRLVAVVCVVAVTVYLVGGGWVVDAQAQALNPTIDNVLWTAVQQALAGVSAATAAAQIVGSNMLWAAVRAGTAAIPYVGLVVVGLSVLALAYTAFYNYQVSVAPIPTSSSPTVFTIGGDTVDVWYQYVGTGPCIPGSNQVTQCYITLMKFPHDTLSSPGPAALIAAGYGAQSETPPFFQICEDATRSCGQPALDIAGHAMSSTYVSGSDKVGSAPVYPGTNDPLPATVQAAAAGSAGDWSAAWGNCAPGNLASVCSQVQAQLTTQPATEAAANMAGVSFSPTLASEAASSPSDTAAQTSQLQTGLLGMIVNVLQSILAGILALPAAVWTAFEGEVGKLFAPDATNLQNQVQAVENAFASRIPFSLVTYVSSFFSSVRVPSDTTCSPPLLTLTLALPNVAPVSQPIDTTMICSVAGIVRPVATWFFGLSAAFFVLKWMLPHFAM